VAFLEGLTDERVRSERAPFDHPSLSVPSGGTPGLTTMAFFPGVNVLDDRFEVPEVGAAGSATPLGTSGTPFASFPDPQRWAGRRPRARGAGPPRPSPREGLRGQGASGSSAVVLMNSTVRSRSTIPASEPSPWMTSAPAALPSRAACSRSQPRERPTMNPAQ
jgi:hypothetical protein